MGFIDYNQEQLMIPMEWKSLIEKDDIVFVINEIVEKMNINKLLETYSPLGSNSYNPKMMLKIILYGYIRKKYSSRAIEEAVRCDIKFIWLAGGNKPTRNVINDFRKDKMKFIMEEVFIELLLILEDKCYINDEEYFSKTSRKKANKGKKIPVEKRREEIRINVQKLMAKIDKINEKESKIYKNKILHPKEISEEELEDFAKRLSEKMN